MLSSVRWFGMALLVLAVGLADRATAGYITPVSATGTGTYNGNAGVIIDGVTPPRGTSAGTAGLNVTWNDPATSFTINFGKVYTVGSLIVSVDNNDDYIIQSSTDGINFTNLFRFLANDGPVTPNQGGLDILTTDSSYPSLVTYPGDSTTPEYVGRSFAPTNAQYLRITAANGDSVYSIGEIDAFTPSVVPEPSSLMLTSIAGLAGLGYWARRRRGSIAT